MTFRSSHFCFSHIFFEFFTRTFSGLVDILILDISLFEGQRLLANRGHDRIEASPLQSHRVTFSLEGWTKADTSSATSHGETMTNLSE